MIITGIIGIFIPWGNTIELIYSWFGGFLFAGYTMYDIQKLKRYPENMFIEAQHFNFIWTYSIYFYIFCEQFRQADAKILKK